MHPLIRCSLYSVKDRDKDSGPHVHKLVRKIVDDVGRVMAEEDDDPHDIFVSAPNYTAS